MANHLGNGGKVLVDTNTVAEVKSFSIDESADAIDNSNLDSTSRSFVAGKTQWSGSIECQFDETDANGQEALTVGATVTLKFHPEGTGAGNEELTGSAIITGRGVALAEDAIVTQSFTFQGTGALTRQDQV